MKDTYYLITTLIIILVFLGHNAILPNSLEDNKVISIDKIENTAVLLNYGRVFYAKDKLVRQIQIKDVDSGFIEIKYVPIGETNRFVIGDTLK